MRAVKWKGVHSYGPFSFFFFFFEEPYALGTACARTRTNAWNEKTNNETENARKEVGREREKDGEREGPRSRYAIM